HYTIGQRRGLGIGGREPLYVVKLDPEAKHVIVGPKEALATRRIPLKEVNWLGDVPFDSAPSEGWEVRVRVRSTRPPKEARVFPTGPNTAEVELAVAEEGVSPGQACVFYGLDDTRVLGGGWITK
ncbi:MAG TPA: aminomethyltransferase beta-barrel domain-containing protein, partial [Paracoccaceae bacterium]|nr:aminomethyltransferase beta-barrel domain-containing protein [Paracoccaceae bacterium]